MRLWPRGRNGVASSSMRLPAASLFIVCVKTSDDTEVMNTEEEPILPVSQESTDCWQKVKTLQFATIFAKFKVVAVIIGLILTQAVGSVLYVRLAFKMKHHEFLMPVFIYPLSYCILLWPIVFFWLYKGTITPNQRKFPLWKICVIAVLQTIGNSMFVLPSTIIGGVVQGILGQLVIISTLVLSFFVLKTRFMWTHLVGATLIIGGTF